MPYKNVQDIPSYVKKYPQNIQRQWMHVFNSVFKNTSDDEQAFRSANNVISRHLEKLSEHSVLFAYNVDKFLGVLGVK